MSFFARPSTAILKRSMVVSGRQSAFRRSFLTTPVRRTGRHSTYFVPNAKLTGAAATGLTCIALNFISNKISDNRVFAETENLDFDPEVVKVDDDEYSDIPVLVTRTPLRKQADSSGRIETTGKEERVKEIVQELEVENAETRVRDVASTSNDATDEFMDFAPYLLIGAGTASFAAFRAIRARDPTAKILIIGEEDRAPYMRPPLSKELWYPPIDKSVTDRRSAFIENTMANDENLKFIQWHGRERSLYYEPEHFYFPPEVLKERLNGGISIVKGVRVERINAEKQVAYLSNGKKVYYGKCLIATGGKPKNIAVFKGQKNLEKHVTLFRNVKDFFKLHEVTQNIKDITIIGGGFLGSELACAIAARSKAFGLNVTQIFPEEGNMAKVLPKYLSDWTTDKVRVEGVNVLKHSLVDSALYDEAKSKVKLLLSSGRLIETDHVVVACGIEPERSLAEQSGLELDDKLGGYRVNAELEARTNLWVAGDAACFYDPLLGRRRVEHHDHAVVSGRLAGGNMAGDAKPYSHQSMFWSDLGPDIGYEAIGLVDSRLPTVGVFAKATEKDSPKGIVTATNESMRSESEANLDFANKPVLQEAVAPLPDSLKKHEDDYGKGVIFYLKDDIVVGLLMWNVFNKMQVARKVLREHRHYDDLSEVAKLFNIHSFPDPVPEE